MITECSPPPFPNTHTNMHTRTYAHIQKEDKAEKGKKGFLALMEAFHYTARTLTLPSSV